MRRLTMLAALVCWAAVVAAQPTAVSWRALTKDSASAPWKWNTVVFGSGFTFSRGGGVDTVKATGGGGGAGDTTFSWSVTGSAAVEDSLRFVQAYGGTWARTGNTVTYTPDTSTENTGLATVGDITRGTSDSSRASWKADTLTGDVGLMKVNDSLNVGADFAVNSAGTIKELGNTATAGLLGAPAIIYSSFLSEVPGSGVIYEEMAAPPDSGLYRLSWWLYCDGRGDPSAISLKIQNPSCGFITADVILATVDEDIDAWYQGSQVLFFPSGCGTIVTTLEGSGTGATFYFAMAWEQLHKQP